MGLRFSGAWLPAAIAIVAYLALPFGRPGRPFLTIDPDLYALALGGPLLWLVLLAAVASFVVSLLKLNTAVRGDLLIATGTVGFGAGVLWFILSATPFGIGALVTLAALALVLGSALSESGRVQGDAFIATSILLVSLFVVLFIIYPLFTVLRAAVIIDGSFDLSQLRRTLTHPLFFFLDNPRSQVDEIALTLRVGAVVALPDRGMGRRAASQPPSRRLAPGARRRRRADPRRAALRPRCAPHQPPDRGHRRADLHLPGTRLRAARAARAAQAGAALARRDQRAADHHAAVHPGVRHDLPARSPRPHHARRLRPLEQLDLRDLGRGHRADPGLHADRLPAAARLDLVAQPRARGGRPDARGGALDHPAHDHVAAGASRPRGRLPAVDDRVARGLRQPDHPGRRP
jgi:hypothetical protein